MATTTNDPAATAEPPAAVQPPVQQPGQQPPTAAQPPVDETPDPDDITADTGDDEVEHLWTPSEPANLEGVEALNRERLRQAKRDLQAAQERVDLATETLKDAKSARADRDAKAKKDQARIDRANKDRQDKVAKDKADREKAAAEVA